MRAREWIFPFSLRAPDHRDHPDRSIVITWIGLVIT
jgi:hypothetical protein